jgi:hypothetical protein
MNTHAEPSWRSIQKIEAALESLAITPSFSSTHYAMVELTNGPGDGQVGFVEVELPRMLRPIIKDIDGDFVQTTYVRAGDSIPLVLAFKCSDDWLEGDYDKLRAAFKGTDPVRYSCVRDDDDA